MSPLRSKSCGHGEPGGPRPLEGAAGPEDNPLLHSAEPALETCILGTSKCQRAGIPLLLDELSRWDCAGKNPPQTPTVQQQELR